MTTTTQKEVAHGNQNNKIKKRNVIEQKGGAASLADNQPHIPKATADKKIVIRQINRIKVENNI
jgi:hypothetical protein